jgi:hypothetical protein
VEGKQGVLLPDLDNIKTANQQLKVCLRKGGFKNNNTYELFRFEVKQFKQTPTAHSIKRTIDFTQLFSYSLTKPL